MPIVMAIMLAGALGLYAVRRQYVEGGAPPDVGDDHYGPKWVDRKNNVVPAVGQTVRASAADGDMQVYVQQILGNGSEIHGQVTYTESQSVYAGAWLDVPLETITYS